MGGRQEGAWDPGGKWVFWVPGPGILSLDLSTMQLGGPSPWSTFPLSGLQPSSSWLGRNLNSKP